jgi:hypothetical protein
MASEAMATLLACWSSARGGCASCLLGRGRRAVEVAQLQARHALGCPGGGSQLVAERRGVLQPL